MIMVGQHKLLSLQIIYMVYELLFCADLLKSAENNITITVLVVVLVCILVFLTVIVAIVIVICIVFKKKSKLDLQEHVYDSVSLPALSTHTLVSKSTKVDDYDKVKKPSDSPQKFELIDNIAYNSYKTLSAVKPTPNTESTAAADL